MRRELGADMRKVICTAFLAFALSSPAMSQALAQQRPSTAVPVGIVKAERKPIAKAGDFVGRVEAIGRVEIRSRITGFLEAELFKEGDLVKEGAPLYRIEKGLFQAQVQQAESALKRSKAAKTLSALQLGRAEELVEKQVGTLVARDQARAQDEQADAAVLSDEANLATARINLGYTDIVAPITGKVGRTNITKGNVVSPESGSLTVIVSQGPDVSPSLPGQPAGLFARAQAAGRQIDISNIKARLRFADGQDITSKKASSTSSIVRVDRSYRHDPRARHFPKPCRHARRRAVRSRSKSNSDKPEEKVVIPQAALIADQEGVYVFAAEDGKATVKRVKPGSTTDAGVAIDQGTLGRRTGRSWMV